MNFRYCSYFSNGGFTVKTSKLAFSVIAIVILCVAYTKVEWFHLVSISKPPVTTSTYAFEWMCNLPLYVIGMLLNGICCGLPDIKKIKINPAPLLVGLGFFVASMRPIVILLTGSLPNASIYTHIKGVFCILCGFFIMMSFTVNHSIDR